MKNYILASVAALSLTTAPLAAQDSFSKEEIKQLALEAILENPEIVMQAVEILRERERADQAARATTALEEQKELILSDPNAVVLGNPEGDITLVEFFDYNCGYCKRATPAVQALLDTDENLRVVMREFPILGEGSVFAARASLAAREQGKYEEFHFALMKLPRATEAAVMGAAEKLGMDVAKLKADMDDPSIQEHFDTTKKLGDALGFSGTPSFIIGEEVVPGFVPLETMQEIIKEQRMAQK